MQAPRPSKALVSVLVALGLSGTAVGAASCAASGQGTNESFDSSTPDGTTGNEASTGDDSGTTADTGGGGSTCDADTQNDWTNCGMCGHRCPPGNLCSCGTCVGNCEAGLTTCCGTCADTKNDINNCGMCGNICLPPQSGNGVPECVNSACTYTCPSDAGLVQCGADSGTAGCFDPKSSGQACGGCGITCSGTTPSCVDGKCCPTGNKLCGGVCTAVQSDPNNCGGCGITCSGTAQCTAGKCVGYTVTNPTLPFLDACSLPGATTILRNANSGWINNGSLLNLPITFSFYGTAETQFWLQNQGAIGLGAPMGLFPPVPDGFPLCQGGSNYPENLYPAAVAFGDSSMATGAQGVCYAKLSPAADAGAGDAGAGDAGDAGDSGGGNAGAQFVVTWEHATLQTDPGSDITVSVVLTEGTNTIDFQYQMVGGGDGGLDTFVAGSNASVGLLQGNGATLSTWPYCNQAFITSNPYSVRFAP